MRARGKNPSSANASAWKRCLSPYSFHQFTATEGRFKSGVQRLRRSSSCLPQAAFKEDQETVCASQHLRAILRGKIVINAQPDLAAVPCVYGDDPRRKP